MTIRDDRAFPAKAVIAGELLTNQDIENAELERARHALAYLKRKLGNDAIRELLKHDIAEMTTHVRNWVEASGGTWQTGAVELTVPGPNAKAFHEWYTSALANSREAELRAGHPEHFVLHPRVDATEVVENIGETELPWWIVYHPLSDDHDFPMSWDADYPVHFGMEILDSNGLRVGFTMHQLRDDEAELHLKLTTFLPSAAPHELVYRHLHHFTIEFRNWTRFAWLESLNVNDSNLFPLHSHPDIGREQSSEIKRDDTMKIVRKSVQHSELGASQQFTGSVWNEVLAVGGPPSRLHVARVTFTPAARTAWHTHPRGQILLVVSGIGRIQKGGEPVIALYPGDSVSIAPGERHWHGAAPDQVFVHIAMQEATPEGQMAVWLEHVTDEGYRQTPESLYTSHAGSKNDE